MIRLIFKNEIKNIVAGPKFVMTFIISTLLVMLSVYLGILNYQAHLESYYAGEQLVKQEQNNQMSWAQFDTKVYRKPEPMQIFVSGVSNDIGRYTHILASPVKLVHSIYSDNPIFAAFRLLDFQTVVMVILPLLAILFTFDAVNREKENGVLALVFSNAVPRNKYILGKFIAIWTGLVTPVLLAVLLGFLFVLMFGIALTGREWLFLFVMLMVSLVYFSFFIAFGVFISTLTTRSAGSFLILIAGWIIMVFFIPRLGIMLSYQVYPVPSVEETEANIQGYANLEWAKFAKQLEGLWQERNRAQIDMTEQQKQDFQNESMWLWIQQEDSMRKAVLEDIDKFTDKSHQQIRNRQTQQEDLALDFFKLSPASLLHTVLLNIAETDIHLKARYETDAEQYKNVLSDYVVKKEKSEGNIGGIRVTFGPAGLKIDTGRQAQLNTSDMPVFEKSCLSFGTLFLSSLNSIMLLLFYTVICLAGAFVAFTRYDVR